MTDGFVPHRPKEIEIRIPVADKNCIEYAVVFGTKNEEAFLLFHPEYLTGDGKLSNSGRRACRDFFGYSKNKEYRDAYIALLKKDGGREAGAADDSAEEELTEERKAGATRLLLLQLIGMIEKGKISDPELMKLVTDLAVKVKLFKEDSDEPEKARRYLPPLCKRECQYRLFVERGIESGEIENECLYCKALAFAKERGFIYDPTKLLDLPWADDGSFQPAQEAEEAQTDETDKHE